MAAVWLSLASAVLFGSLSVTLNFALRRNADAELGALATVLAALVPVGIGTLSRFDWTTDVWPYLLAGLLAPGCSQIFYVLAVREAGPSRTSLVVGASPLVSVSIALIALGEPVRAPLVVGAILIVLGGVALALERVRPEAFRAIGLLFAAGCGAFFATRDNVVRHLATSSHVSPELAALATLVSGGTAIGLYLVLRRGLRGSVTGLADAIVAFTPSGIVWGLSYVEPVRGVLTRARVDHQPARRDRVARRRRPRRGRAAQERAGRPEPLARRRADRRRRSVDRRLSLRHGETAGFPR